jgi:hypothetical protein
MEYNKGTPVVWYVVTNIFEECIASNLKPEVEAMCSSDTMVTVYQTS